MKWNLGDCVCVDELLRKIRDTLAETLDAPQLVVHQDVTGDQLMALGWRVVRNRKIWRMIRPQLRERAPTRELALLVLDGGNAKAMRQLALKCVSKTVLRDKLIALLNQAKRNSRE